MLNFIYCMLEDDCENLAKESSNTMILEVRLLSQGKKCAVRSNSRRGLAGYWGECGVNGLLLVCSTSFAYSKDLDFLTLYNVKGTKFWIHQH